MTFEQFVIAEINLIMNRTWWGNKAQQMNSWELAAEVLKEAIRANKEFVLRDPQAITACITEAMIYESPRNFTTNRRASFRAHLVDLDKTIANK